MGAGSDGDGGLVIVHETHVGRTGCDIRAGGRFGSNLAAERAAVADARAEIARGEVFPLEEIKRELA